MILVILGTQDKDFSRLLRAVDREIKKGTIKEKVVVQAGQTKYKSKNMEIFDLLPAPEFEKLMDKASLIITHGGAGSILSAIKKGKRVIAAARLAKYKEHHNDHQKQIIEEFVKQGYILELEDFNTLGDLIKESKKMPQKKFVSNTDNMIKLIEDYIKDTNNISWYNKHYKKIAFCFLLLVALIINIFTLVVCIRVGINIYISSLIAWSLTALFIYLKK